MTVVARHSGEEGARTIDYLSGGMPWKVLEDPGRIVCHRAYRGLRPINTAYLSAVELESSRLVFSNREIYIASRAPIFSLYLYI